MPSLERGAGWVLALAIAVAGWFVGHGFGTGRARDRFVSVKGVSEREVKADLALWPLQLASTATVAPGSSRRVPWAWALRP